MQDVIYMVEELMAGGDLYSAIAKDAVYEGLTWYKRCALAQYAATLPSVWKQVSEVSAGWHHCGMICAKCKCKIMYHMPPRGSSSILMNLEKHVSRFISLQTC